jgi:soluble lytic murein transglycosylase-like protein
MLALMLGAPAARADVYASEQDGVLHITSEKPRNTKVLFHLRDEGGRGVGPGSAPRAASASPRRSGATPKGDLPTREDLAPVVQKAAQYYNLPEALIWAVMKIESGFYSNAVSSVGAQGLMQLMPGTARDMGVSDAFDPVQSIFGGARYLRMLANRFSGDLVLTLSGYHAGGGAVDKVGGIPYTQTAEYVRMVLNAYYAYQRQLPAQPRP